MGNIQFRKLSTIRHLDVCFNNVNTFIETMQYCYDNMIALCLVDTNKLKFMKFEGGNENKCQERKRSVLCILDSYLICKCY